MEMKKRRHDQRQKKKKSRKSWDKKGKLKLEIIK